MRNLADHPTTLAVLDATRAMLDAGAPQVVSTLHPEPLAEAGPERLMGILGTRELILEELAERSMEDILGRLEWAQTSDEAALVLLDHLSVMALLETRGALNPRGAIRRALVTALATPQAWWIVPAWIAILLEASRLGRPNREVYPVLMGVEACSHLA